MDKYYDCFSQYIIFKRINSKFPTMKSTWKLELTQMAENEKKE